MRNVTLPKATSAIGAGLVVHVPTQGMRSPPKLLAGDGHELGMAPAPLASHGAPR
jgi:hypothetical protein